MSNYKRLTNKEYLNKPKCFNCEHNYSNCIICERHCVDGDCFVLRSELRQLSELEDKIGNGTLVEFPFKVGDKVYFLSGKKIIEEIVTRTHYAIINGKLELINCYILTNEPNDDYDNFYRLSKLGKSLFLTKAEAEKKLRELKGGE